MTNIYKKRLINATALSALALGVLAFRPEVTQAEGGTVDRIQGNDRYETATLISSQAYKNSETVIIANAMEFADALSGVPLAYEKEAPILLAHGTKLKTSTITEIKRLGAKEAIILGGDAAISQSVENELKALGLSVQRLSGGDRYETSTIIADELAKTAPSDKAVIVDGMESADAMSIAPFAAQEGMPIYLTKTNSLSNADELKDYSKTYIVGGENAVSKIVEDTLNSVTRLAGMDRYETNLEVLDYFGVEASELFVSTGLKFADALTGSVLAARNNSAVALVKGDVHSKLSDYFQRNPFKDFTILGGEVAVSNRVYNSLITYAGRKLKATSIKIVSETGSNEVFPDAKLPLKVITEPEDAEIDVYWSSPKGSSYRQGLFSHYIPGEYIVTAWSQDDSEVRDEFKVVVKDKFSIINYTGSAARVILPERIESKDIKNMHNYKFDYLDLTIGGIGLGDPSRATAGYLTYIRDDSFFNKNIEEVIFSNHIKSVGENAFRGNFIKTLDLPHSLTRIGYKAFSENMITELELPDSIEWLESDSFSKNKINHLKLPANLKTINSDTFSSNELSHLDMNDALKVIGHDSFSHNNIETIDFSNITEIGSYAFQNNLITDLTIPDGVTNIADYTFYRNKIKNLKLTNNIYTIGEGSFKYNNIETLLIPDSIKKIELSAFSNNNIKDLTLPNDLISIGGYAFKSNNISHLKMNDTLSMIGSGAFSNNKIETVEFSENIDVIESYTFYNNLLTSLILPDSIIQIGNHAFSNNNLVSLSLPSNVTSIGDEAFKDNYLEQINIPEAVTSIGSSAFENNKLNLLVMNTSIENIGTRAFRNNELKSVILPSSLKAIGNSAFSSNDLTEISVPKSISIIGDGAFALNQLENVKLEEGLEVIGKYAFQHNGELSSILLPTSLKEIGEEAFYNAGLTELIVPGNISVINKGAFYNNNLQDIILEEGVAVIGENAFQYNSGLKTVSLPSSLREIGEKSFNSTVIKEITFPQGLEVIEREAFNRIYSDGYLSKITIGDDVNIGNNIIDDTNNFKEAYEKHGAGIYYKNYDKTWRFIASNNVTTNK